MSYIIIYTIYIHEDNLIHLNELSQLKVAYMYLKNLYPNKNKIMFETLIVNLSISFMIYICYFQ